jgi:hypothetical protein
LEEKFIETKIGTLHKIIKTAIYSSSTAHLPSRRENKFTNNNKEVCYQLI